MTDDKLVDALVALTGNSHRPASQAVADEIHKLVDPTWDPPGEEIPEDPPGNNPPEPTEEPFNA